MPFAPKLPMLINGIRRQRTMEAITHSLKQRAENFLHHGPERILSAVRRPQSRSPLSRGVLIAEAAAIGAAVAATYLLDPQQGRRRRVMLRDKLAKEFRRSGRMAGKVGRDLRNRTQGIFAETRAVLSRDPESGDGREPQPTTRLDILQANWAPATRALVCAGGLTLAGVGIRRGGGIGAALMVCAAAMLIRAVTNHGLADTVERTVDVAVSSSALSDLRDVAHRAT
jgi:hypothetical protein